MSDRMLKGKVTLITGASSGIGASIALRFATEGSGLLLTARREEKLQEVAKKCRDEGAAFCEVLPCDLSDPASIDELAARVLDHHQALDVLVCNAGTAAGDEDILKGNPDDWEKMLFTNTLSTMRLTHHFAKGMVKRGNGLIVTTGSIAGTESYSNPSTAIYSASKHAVRGWALACYEELRQHGIHTLLIEPGYVATDMALPSGKLVPEMCIQPEDIAEAALLPLRMSPNAVPVELVMRVVRSPYRQQNQW